jgi:SAM-dependent methyltransferase
MPRPEIYEDSRIWAAEVFHSGDQQARFQATASLIQADVTSLLDVGTGNGAFLAHLERTTQLKLHGLEPSAAARAARVCQAGVDAGSAEVLPFDDGAFDAVSALEVIEHLDFNAYSQALAELKRVAARYVIVSVPYQEHTDLTRCPECGCRFHPDYHMRSFDSNAMAELLPPMRLSRTEIIHDLDYLGGDFLRWLYHRVAPGSIFPATSACPQCGFSGDNLTSDQGGPALAVRRNLAGRIRGRLPRVRRARWIIALYEH